MKGQALVNGFSKFKGLSASKLEFLFKYLKAFFKSIDKDIDNVDIDIAGIVADIDNALTLVCQSLGAELVLNNIMHSAAGGICTASIICTIDNSNDQDDMVKQLLETETDVIQDVDHGEEEAAQREPSLLQEQADHDWADGVLNFVLQDSQEFANEREDVHVYTYSRTPKEFIRALLEGQDLGHVREALANHGYNCVLESGAKVFVKPEQYSVVMQALEQSDIVLRSSCVIVAQTFVPELEASLASIASRKNVRVKKAGKLHMETMCNSQRALSSEMLGEIGHDLSSTRGHELTFEYAGNIPELANLEVKRTFLCSVVPKREPGSVNQSTAEAHGGPNPRRVVVNW